MFATEVVLGKTWDRHRLNIKASERAWQEVAMKFGCSVMLLPDITYQLAKGEVGVQLPIAVHALASFQAPYGEYRQFIARLNATEKYG